MTNRTNETKFCKHCKSEIPAKAKVCPNCRKKQGGKIKWILIIVAIIIILALATNGSDDEPKKVGDSSPTTGQKPSNSESKKFTKGETAEYKNVQVTLTDYFESNGSEYLKPTDGNIFLIVEFEIANNSKEEISVSSLLSFDAYVDGYSTSLSISAETSIENASSLDGTVAAGKKIKGILGYEIPSDWKEFEINYTHDIWDDTKFEFTFSK